MKNSSFRSSLGNALQGMKFLFSKERNFRIQLLVAFIVLFAGYIAEITALDFIILLFSIALVLICEAINTCIEVLCNKVEPEYCEQIKITKDIGAASVTMASMLSIMVGIYVFLF
jgi:diacylglycerol kinase